MAYSFKQLSDGFLQCEELRGNGNLLVTFTVLCDYMRLSRTKHNKFYDEKEKDYYIIYTHKKMKETFGIDPKTVGKFYRYLAEHGFIVLKKLGVHKPDKIFLTDRTKKLLDMKDKGKNDGSDSNDDDSDRDSDQGEENSHSGEENSNSRKKFPSSNSQANKTDVNHRDDVYSGNSVNSGQPQNEKSSLNKSPDRSSDENSNGSSILDLGKLSTKRAKTTKRWIQGVHKKLKLDVTVINSALKISNYDIPSAYHIIDLIKNARTNVANDNNLPWNDKRVRFETNQNFRSRLADKLLYIHNYAKKKAHDANEFGRYFTTSLKEFIKDALGLSDEVPQVKPRMDEDELNEYNSSDEYYDDGNDQVHISDDGYDYQTNDQDTSAPSQKTGEMPRIPIFKIQ